MNKDCFWQVNGNVGTCPCTNFIGTTDAIDFIIKTNNIERARWDVCNVISGGPALDLRPGCTVFLPDCIFMRQTMQIVTVENCSASSVQITLNNCVCATTRRFLLSTGDVGFGNFQFTLGRTCQPNELLASGCCFDFRFSNTSLNQAFTFEVNDGGCQFEILKVDANGGCCIPEVNIDAAAGITGFLRLGGIGVLNPDIQIQSNTCGVLQLEAINQTNNENMTIDFETSADRIVIDSSNTDLVFRYNREVIIPSFYEADLTLESTTSSTPQVKVALTETTLAGDYLITWSADIGNESKGKTTNATIVLDGCTTLSANVVSNSDQDDYFLSFSGSKEVTLTAASHAFTLNWFVGNEVDVSTIQNASLRLVRIRE